MARAKRCWRNSPHQTLPPRWTQRRGSSPSAPASILLRRRTCACRLARMVLAVGDGRVVGHRMSARDAAGARGLACACIPTGTSCGQPRWCVCVAAQVRDAVLQRQAGHERDRHPVDLRLVRAPLPHPPSPCLSSSGPTFGPCTPPSASLPLVQWTYVWSVPSPSLPLVQWGPAFGLRTPPSVLPDPPFPPFSCLEIMTQILI